MPAKLICPECGGVIGELTRDTDTPCTCLRGARTDNDAYRQAAAAAPGHDAAPRDAAPTDDAPEAGESAKVCRICGKSVTGKKRYKDTLGYWCVDCHKKEKKQRTAGQERCTGCGRMFPRERLLDSGADVLCRTCNRDRIAKQREMIRSAEKGHIHTTHEKRQLLILLGIVVLLVLIILLSRAGIL